MIISLNGKWDVRDLSGEFKFSGSVPGTVQGDLVDLGLMPHPYKGTNEYLFEKLEYKDWVYETQFVMDEVNSDFRYDLVFRGIDTLASVYLNDEFLGKTEDMFLEYRFSVGHIVRPGTNKIRVIIKSPIKEPAALMQNYGRLTATHEYDVRPYIRKAQYSYGWDWGARIVTSGIWRDVFIEVREDARLYGSTAFLENLDGIISVTGYVEGLADHISKYSVRVYLDNKKVGEFPLESDVSGTYFEGAFKKEGISLWYPRGMGKPMLHKFRFSLMKRNKEIYKEEKEIGLRIVKLLREKDEEGESFVFHINGKPVFIKGANWIPQDNILSWSSPKNYEELIKMAYNANMNMLRVWGGGIYEDETFYKICDKLGIMVWQDFMFACAEYPDHLEWFRELANREVRENIVKLRHHSSIVLWCGNNENNWGFDEWPFFAHKVDGKFLGNTLYLEDFPKICKEEDPSRPYWPSSPYGGKRPNAEDGGDRHNWDIWSGWQDYTAYLNDHGRFLSEFGFQSAPDPKTIEFFAKPEEKDIFSEVMLSHNKQEEGPERIMKFIHNHFGLVTDFDAILYLSQINQAEAMKTGVEHWRGRKYKTAGTIYWQLNDSWPVFSWSAIDYFKRPKALYYYTKRFYQEILPVVLHYKDKVIFKLINDGKNVSGKLKIDAFDIENGDRIYEKTYGSLMMPSDSVADIDTLPFREFKNSLVFMRFETESGVYENEKLFANLRAASMINPQIEVKIQDNTIEVMSKKPAFGVYIIAKTAEENFFSLPPDIPKLISVKEFEGIKSMYDFLNQ